MSGVTRDKVDLHSALPLHNTSQQEIFHTLWCQTLNCQPTFCWLRLVVSFWYSKMIIWCLEEILLSYWDIVILYRVLLKAAGVQIQFIIAQHIRYTSSLEQEQRHTWGQTSNWVLVLSGVMATVSSVLISTFDLHEEADNRYNLDTVLLHPLDTHPIETTPAARPTSKFYRMTFELENFI